MTVMQLQVNDARQGMDGESRPSRRGKAAEVRIYEGTDEIQRRTIARNLLKGHASIRGFLG